MIGLVGKPGYCYRYDYMFGYYLSVRTFLAMTNISCMTMTYYKISKRLQKLHLKRVMSMNAAAASKMRDAIALHASSSSHNADGESPPPPAQPAPPLHQSPQPRPAPNLKETPAANIISGRQQNTLSLSISANSIWFRFGSIAKFVFTLSCKNTTFSQEYCRRYINCRVLRKSFDHDHCIIPKK